MELVSESTGVGSCGRAEQACGGGTEGQQLMFPSRHLHPRLLLRSFVKLAPPAPCCGHVIPFIRPPPAGGLRSLGCKLVQGEGWGLAGLIAPLCHGGSLPGKVHPQGVLSFLQLP